MVDLLRDEKTILIRQLFSEQSEIRGLLKNYEVKKRDSTVIPKS